MRFGAYEVDGEIGRGGMGVVYRAWAPDGTRIAVKVLAASRTRRDALVRFDRERRLLAELGADAGFVPLIDAGMGLSGAWIAMPLVEGGTLRDRLRRHGSLGVDETVVIGRALAAALAAAHERGIVHRDLKPENVLFDATGRPLVADLGLAKHFANTVDAGQSQSLSRTGEMRGTFGYMAPEQIRDAKSAGPSADLYALGVILHECLTGDAPFADAAGNPVSALQAALHRDVPSLRRSRPEVPAWLDACVRRALARDPSARHGSAGALADALAEGEGGQPGSAPDPSFRRTVALVVSGCLIAAAIAIVVAITRVPETELRPADGPRDLDRDLEPSDPLPAGTWWTPTDAQREAARRLSLPVWFEHEPGMRFVLVPRGTFTMGSPEHEQPRGENERRHQVTLTDDLYVAATEVTNAQLRRLRPEHDGGEHEGLGVNADAQPAVRVDWNDASAFCEQLSQEAGEAESYRLPTESEWEYFARAGTTTARFWGDGEAEAGRFANVADATARELWGEHWLSGWNDGWGPRFFPTDDGHAVTAPVGSYEPNPWGLFDVLGNAWEWCSDWYGEYPQGEATDPTGAASGEHRVLRGASWINEPRFGRSAVRLWFGPTYRHEDVGFRVVCSVDGARRRVARAGRSPRDR